MEGEVRGPYVSLPRAREGKLLLSILGQFLGFEPFFPRSDCALHAADKCFVKSHRCLIQTTHSLLANIVG